MWVESTHMYVGRFVIIENLPRSGFVQFIKNVDNNLNYIYVYIPKTPKSISISVQNFVKYRTN